MEQIITALLEQSPAYLLLAYLIYKDWRNSETTTKALTRIDTSLDRLIKTLSKRGDEK